MGTFSDTITTTATNLLTKFGQSVSFVRQVESVYDPATSETTVASTINYTAFGSINEYSKFERESEFVDQNDLELMINKPTEVPAVGDKVTVSSIEYRVKAVEKLIAQGDDIAYVLQIGN